jgi:hypothetical protein
VLFAQSASTRATALAGATTAAEVEDGMVSEARMSDSRGRNSELEPREFLLVRPPLARGTGDALTLVFVFDPLATLSPSLACFMFSGQVRTVPPSAAVDR